MRLLQFLINLIILVPLFASWLSLDSFPDTSQTLLHQLADKSILIKKSVYQRPNINFLVLHDNENTGVEAATKFCIANGGAVTELVYGNERFITFGKGVLQYSFDPNQIFSRMGIRTSLRKYSKAKVGENIIDLAENLAAQVLSLYLRDSLDYMVTLHNNSDLNFDILSYASEGYLRHVVDSLFINKEMDPDDFVLVTEPSFFSFLKSRNISVVYQSPLGPPDGSLSVYAQQNKIPYVNIEVQHGHFDEHFRLITVISEMFSSLHFNKDGAFEKPANRSASAIEQ